MAEPFAAIAPFYDLVMQRIPYADWADYVEALVRQWHGGAARTLDLACGTGSVALELSRRGWAVIGVDRSRPMLVAGREKCREYGQSVPLVVQDMRRLGFADGFDLVICLFDSLNYLLELDDLKATFEGVRRALVRDGLFIFDLNTEAALERELFTQEEMEEGLPIRLRWRSRYDRRSRTTRVDMEFFLDDGRRVTETHQERAYTPAELKQALAGAGLETLAVYDAYTFRLPRKGSDRVFYVCRAGKDKRS